MEVLGCPGPIILAFMEEQIESFTLQKFKDVPHYAHSPISKVFFLYRNTYLVK